MKKDILGAIIIGEISAWLALAIFKNLSDKLPTWWLLPLALPILCAVAMAVAIFLKNRLAILYQFAKFFLVGIFNTLVDLGILNLLIAGTSTSSGIVYTAFKGISFLIASINSYFWNKLWTFNAAKGSFSQFLAVSAIGFLINVGIASAIVNLIGPQFGLPVNTWANVGALTGSMIGLIWNFAGYKFIVFK